MSLATICRRVAALAGVSPADTWAGNPDLTASEIVAWVQEAQQAVATAYDWSTLVGGVAQSVTGTSPATYALPAGLARIIPDSMRLDGCHVRGALTTAEWDLLLAGLARGPAYTLRAGKLLLAHGGGGLLEYSYVGAVPDFVSDPDETALGGGVPELVRMFESCILYGALAAYRDSKGLPAGTAASQAMAALADARGRDQPVGALTLAKRHHHHRHGGISIIGPVTAGLDHALLDDLEPDDDPLSDDFAP